MQRPPAFSAIKIDGERAYDLARAGETVELAPRPVYIEALQLLDSTAETATLEMTCEKGTYVRSLARDLARHLGTFGHVIALRRTAVGPFTEVIAIDLSTLEAAENRDSLLRPVSAGLVGLAEIRISAEQVSAVRHGNPVLLTGAGAPIALEECWASFAGSAVALGRVEYGQFKPSRVLAG